MEFHGLTEIPVSGRIACRSTQLPPLHADPCDRIIVATALVSAIAVLSPDPLIAAYPGIEVAW
jgi:PIN domain nuclease of toxin-antitoxin system